MSIRFMPSHSFSLSSLTFSVVVFILAFPPSTVAVCPVPEIPANSEFFKRDLVFTGTVLSVREVHDANDAIDIEGWLYRVKAEKVFRGAPRREVEVFTENTSGRFPLEKNREYLLFASRKANRFEIDNCSNSALVSEAADSLERLNKLITGKQPTEIEGSVVGETEGIDVSGIRVTFKGHSKKYSAISDAKGHFQLFVPFGRYRLVFDPKQYYFSGADLFWYDPDHFVLHRGECARLQVVSIRHRDK